MTEAVGLLGLVLGALLRNTAAGISALFGRLFAPQLVLGLMPESVSAAVCRYLPSPAGAAVSAVHHDPLTLGPWSGLGLFWLYAAVVLTLPRGCCAGATSEPATPPPKGALRCDEHAGSPC